jgi:PBP1b-binding outer membrane lipoprotein LpoB
MKKAAFAIALALIAAGCSKSPGPILTYAAAYGVAQPAQK